TKLVGHSMWSGAQISGVLGNVLPGPGTLYLSQDLKFSGKVEIGDTLTVTVTVREKRPDGHVVVFDCRVVRNDGVVVASGTAEVVAPQ
ncbi:MaoC family dehydratase, partial [Vibrio parahaemolyticus]